MKDLVPISFWFIPHLSVELLGRLFTLITVIKLCMSCLSAFMLKLITVMIEAFVFKLEYVVCLC